MSSIIEIMDWFLIYQNEHLGPYDEKSLEELYDCGDINQDSLLWREGLSEAKTYREVFEDEKVPEFIALEKSSEVITEDLPPDLPIENLANELPPLPEHKGDWDKTVLEENAAEETPPPFPVDFEVNVSETSQPVKRTNKLLWTSSLVALILLVVFLLLPLFKPLDFTRPEGMGIREYHDLKDELNKPENKEKELFLFTLSPDKKIIWIATNSHLEGALQFTFSSQGLVTLGQGVVEVQGEALLNNHLIEIKNFDLIQGTGFIDGKYNVSLKSVGHLALPPQKIVFSGKKTKIDFTDRKLISSLTLSEFEKAVANKFRVARNNDVAFFETLKEEYRTVQTITGQILKNVEQVFAAGDVNYTEAINQLEQNYKRNYGVFFTSFVLSIDNKYELINKKKFADKIQVISHYTKLKKLAQTIGSETVNILNRLKSENLVVMNADKLKEFEFQNTLQLKEIMTECEKMIQSIK